MRTNIEIDDDLMAEAMKAGPYKTKKEAVDAGLRLLARQAAYREVLKWEGKLNWEGDDSVDWVAVPAPTAALSTGDEPRGVVAAVVAQDAAPGKRRARR